MSGPRIAEIEAHLLNKRRLGSFYLNDVRELAGYARESIAKDEQLQRAVAALDHYTVSPEDAAAMRRWVYDGKRPATVTEAWAANKRNVRAK